MILYTASMMDGSNMKQIIDGIIIPSIICFILKLEMMANDIYD